MKDRMTFGKLKHVLGGEFADMGLADNVECLRRAATGQMFARSTADGKKLSTQVVSTSLPDDYASIIDADGMNLERFRSNPVILWSHRYNEPPIGRALNVWKDGDRILTENEYADTERANEVFGLKKAGFLRASSITFSAEGYVTRDCKDWDTALEKHGLTRETAGTLEIIYTRTTLLEVSDVSIGANRDALVVAVSRGLKLSNDMQAALDVSENKVVEPVAIPETVSLATPTALAPALRNITAEIETIINRMKGRS